MICKRGGFIIQRHNELRYLEADLLNLVCNDVETEPVPQEITGETSSAIVCDRLRSSAIVCDPAIIWKPKFCDLRSKRIP